MLFDILVVVVLVLLNGFFVAAEFAIVKVRHSQVELRMQEGSSAAQTADHILKNLNAYLSATQLGITLASLALGWFGEEVANKFVENCFTMLGYNAHSSTSHTISGVLSFLGITTMHIVFGEQVPKTMAINSPEKTTYVIGFALRIFYNVFKPFIWILNGASNVVVRLFGFSSASHGEEHSTEELKMLLEKGKETGAIQNSEHELIENVFHFNETTAKQVMIPRTKMVAIEASTPDDKILELIDSEGFSRMPVYKNKIDDVVGIISTKDILKMVSKGETIILSNHLRPAYFIPESKKINELLKDFQRKRLHMAVVIDEFGGTAGIVTMEDLIEELVGEISDEDDEEVKPIVEKITETEYQVIGTAPLSDVNDFLRYPLPEADDVETVGGLMNFIFGKIPEEGDEKEFGGYHFTILKTDLKVIQLVKLQEMLKEDD